MIDERLNWGRSGDESTPEGNGTLLMGLTSRVWLQQHEWDCYRKSRNEKKRRLCEVSEFLYIQTHHTLGTMTHDSHFD